MGRNQRYSHRNIPASTATLGAAIADGGVRVKSVCGRCETWTLLDLEQLAAALGPEHSLWDRADPCPAAGCPGTLTYLYNNGSVFRPMRSAID